ncbi:MAG TPA: hypothetical protein VMW08_00125 [Acidimicrobiales bacterium]|nr:hypothetical protein [Acidimicrobiales bacterium]
MWHGYGYLTRGTDRVEIWNNDRVLHYLQGDPLGLTGSPPVNGLKHKTTRVEVNCGCTTLRPLYCEKGSGTDGAYRSPELDGAPWYDPDVPESAEFAGLIVETIEGFDSVVRRTVTDAAIRGGSLGPQRLGARTLTVTGWLRAKTCCAAEYGLRWLEAALTGGACDDCALGELSMFRCCPPDDEGGYFEQVPPTAQFDPQTPGTLTVTDLGGGIYDFVYDDFDRSNVVSLQGGAVNNALGFLPVTLNGADPEGMAQISIGADPAGPEINFSISYGLITAQADVASGTGRELSLTIDTNIDLGLPVENQTRDDLAAALADWITLYGDGAVIAAKPFSNGRAYTAKDGPDPANYDREVLRLGLVDGPTVIERNGTCCDSCGCTDLRVQFTLASESPFIFGPIDWCLEDASFLTEPENEYCLSLFCGDCPEAADPFFRLTCGGDTIFAPPPVFNPIITCYCDPWVQYRMCCSLSNEADWNEASTVIRVEAGNATLRHMKIQAFINPFGDDRPCPCDPDDLFWLCRDPCSVIEIAELPSGSILTVDSRSRISTLELAGGGSQGGTRFITGERGVPFEWVDLAACSTVCFLITVDANHSSQTKVSVGVAERFQASGG